MSSGLACTPVDVDEGLWFHDAMRVRVLGPLAVRDDLVPIGQRARDVLAVLVQRRGRPVPPDVLLDLVWGDDTPRADGVGVVHTVVARLRRQFGSELIATHDSGYVVTGRIRIDEDEVTDELETARRHLDRAEHAEAAAHFRRALDQWRADEAYGGVTDQLVVADRARIAERQAQAVEALIELVLEHLPEQLPDAVDRSLRLCADFPLRERPHQLAMLALAADGRQAEALDAYEALRRRLRDELGIDPSPATRAVHQQVLRQDSAPVRSAPPTPRPRLRASILPAPVSPLIGRETELAAILAALAERRLITLVGPGGVGKSRLLAELGRTVDRDQIVYADLSGLEPGTVDDLADAVALSHGLTAGPGEALARLVAALGGREVLLLVDEAEWVVEPLAALLSALLDGCPRLRAVLTSRRPLELVGERVVAIEPLRLPAPGAPVTEQLTAPAVRLLTDRLADRDLHLGDDPAVVSLAVAIATGVDGLPLGLELVAAQAGTRTLPELAAMVDAPLDLAAERRSGNVRHGSLRTSLHWSIARLSARQRTVLGRLSVFAGRFDAAAARAVAALPETDAVVAELARDALLLVERDGAARLGFRLLRTVQQLAADDLGPEDLTAARRRHRRWYAARWQGAPRCDDLITDVRESYEDYLAALTSALSDGDGDPVADLVLTLSRFWLFAASRRSGLRWTTRALDSGLLSARQDSLVRAQRAALALHHERELVLADTAVALPSLLAAGDLAWAVTAAVVRALELSAGGHHDAAISCAEEGRRAADQVSIERRADALGVLAVVQAAAGDGERAERTIEAAWQAVESTGSAAGRIAVGSNLAFTLVDLDRPARALRLVEDIAPHVGRVLAGVHPDFLASTLGWAALGVGDHRRAATAFSQALADSGEVDRQSVELLLGAACARAALSTGPDGRRMVEVARELCRRVDLVLPAGMVSTVDRTLARLPGADGNDLVELAEQPTEQLAAWLRGAVGQV